MAAFVWDGAQRWAHPSPLPEELGPEEGTEGSLASSCQLALPQQKASPGSWPTLHWSCPSPPSLKTLVVSAEQQARMHLGLPHRALLFPRCWQEEQTHWGQSGHLDSWPPPGLLAASPVLRGGRNGLWHALGLSSKRQGSRGIQMSEVRASTSL